MRKHTSLLLVTVAIPAIILAGVLFLDDRKYYLISLLVVMISILAFFLAFEQRKPQAREVIIVAVLTAIAVAGRAVFFMIPQFKPVIAIVILAGVAFGSEAGFLVGAMTALVSNFFFGMGPFTPWQMFSFGLIGYLAGALSRTGVLSRKKSALCLYGGLSTFFIFGLIMDFSSVFLWTRELTSDLITATLLAGLPFNLMHAGSTVFFLFLFAKPMLEKLDRIKIKYGLIRESEGL